MSEQRLDEGSEPAQSTPELASGPAQSELAATAIASTASEDLRRQRLDEKAFLASAVVAGIIEDTYGRAQLKRRDVGWLYEELQRLGVSQRVIAHMTGQAQSEISEILGGRQPQSYDLLARIFNGLGIPLGLVGMAQCDCPKCLAPKPPAAGRSTNP